MNNIMKRKIKFIGHLVGDNDFLIDIFEGRTRINYFHDIEEVGCTSYQHFKEAANELHYTVV